MCFYGGHSTGYKLGNHPKNIEPCAHRARTVRQRPQRRPKGRKNGKDTIFGNFSPTELLNVLDLTPTSPYRE